MPQSLGEKLRQAREDRGISLSEVAEQTRISSLYLEAIERDDYKPLPGGIFNKGFVKSYAKFIGVDENEALQDYARIAAQNEIAAEHDQKIYRPEVLTDGPSSALLPTILIAAVILALMTAGILFIVNYLLGTEPTPANANVSVPANTNTQPANVPTPLADVPTMENLRVELRAVDDVWLTAVNDGNQTTQTVKAGSSVTFEPKRSLRLSYAKERAAAAQLLINGKPITLPAGPQDAKRNVIVIEINNDNLASIWQTGAITFGQVSVPQVTPQSTVTPADSATTPRPTPASAATPRPKPSPARTQTPALSNTVIPIRPTPNLD